MKTAEERAEKLWINIWPYDWVLKSEVQEDCINRIADEIRAAQAEILEQNEPLVGMRICAAVEEAKRNCVSGSQSSYIAQGKTEAFEEAAKIAELKDDPGMEDFCGSEIAKEIRALAKGLK